MATSFHSIDSGVFVDDDGHADINIPLSKECDHCEGRGKVIDIAAETFTHCEDCNGTGARLTYNGQDLLRFVRDFQNSPDVDAEDLPY